jgi:hypothetical protein
MGKTEQNNKKSRSFERDFLIEKQLLSCCYSLFYTDCAVFKEQRYDK